MQRRTKLNLLYRLKAVFGLVGWRIPFRSWRDYMRLTPEEQEEAWRKFNELMVGFLMKPMQRMFDQKEPLMEFLKEKAGHGSEGRMLTIPLRRKP